MKVSDPIKRAVPFCLCLCILCCLLPAIAAISGSTASIKLCILSDLHYLAAADQAAADGNEWRLYGESAPATEEAIEAVIRQRPDYYKRIPVEWYFRRQEDGRTCKLGKTDQRYKILDSI